MTQIIFFSRFTPWCTVSHSGQNTSEKSFSGREKRKTKYEVEGLHMGKHLFKGCAGDLLLAVPMCIYRLLSLIIIIMTIITRL